MAVQGYAYEMIARDEADNEDSQTKFTCFFLFDDRKPHEAMRRAFEMAYAYMTDVLGWDDDATVGITRWREDATAFDFGDLVE